MPSTLLGAYIHHSNTKKTILFFIGQTKSRTYLHQMRPLTPKETQQEAQLMLTNLRDAFGGQSTSPNIVPFHMLGIVSYCAIVTLSLRRAVFYDIRLQKMS